MQRSSNGSVVVRKTDAGTDRPTADFQKEIKAARRHRIIASPSGRHDGALRLPNFSLTVNVVSEGLMRHWCHCIARVGGGSDPFERR